MFEPCHEKTGLGISDQVLHKPAIHPQEKARNLKFWVYIEEELYYPCSENKGADQLCSYCTADLGLCFRIGNNPVFS